MNNSFLPVSACCVKTAQKAAEYPFVFFFLTMDAEKSVKNVNFPLA